MTNTLIPPQIFKYGFAETVPMPDVEAAFVLAVIATEALYGESETRLLVEHAMDVSAHTCVIDASTDLGRDLNRLFVGFLRREFGDASFSVRRLAETASAKMIEGASR